MQHRKTFPHCSVRLVNVELEGKKAEPASRSSTSGPRSRIEKSCICPAPSFEHRKARVDFIVDQANRFRTNSELIVRQPTWTKRGSTSSTMGRTSAWYRGWRLGLIKLQHKSQTFYCCSRVLYHDCSFETIDQHVQI